MRDHRGEKFRESGNREDRRHYLFEDHETFVRRPKPSTARAKAKASKVARRKNRSSK